MKLTLAERIIICNQLKVMAMLNPERADDYKADIEALEGGYEYDYEDLYLAAFSQEPLPKEESVFVIEVMAMYDALQRSYGKHQPADIPKEEVAFEGFDGNNETKLMAYARYMVEHRGKFDYLQFGRDYLNSHRRMRDQYERMLAVWKGKKSQRYDLSVNDMKEILNA